MGKLDERVAIITGAAQGIGAAYARKLAAEGARLILADVLDSEPLIEEIESTYQGAESAALTVDVSDEAQVNDMVTKTVEKFGRLDILISNAAIFASINHKPFVDIQVEEWDRLMEVNVKGPWLCAKAAVPEMRKNGYGKIVNIGSDAGRVGEYQEAVYGACKGGVIALSKALARELGRHNVRINAIEPSSR